MRLTSIRQLLCLNRVEVVKLTQVGFGDFLANTRVRKLKESVTIIKKDFVIKFLTVPNTNKLK